jgi:hypothetical protein
MIRTLGTGAMADMARCLFDPAVAGQYEMQVPVKGCKVVYAIKTNQSTRGAYQVTDAVPNSAFDIQGRYYGLTDNNTWFQILTSGGGQAITVGRDVSPDAGSQTSPVFGVAGTDEWISITTTGNFTGTTCTYDMGVAVAGTITINSDIALEDLSITLGTKTIEAVVAEINSFNPHGTGAVYLATILRADRTKTQASYMDLLSATNCVNPVIAKNFGISYDMVEWLQVSCFYCTGNWDAGYKPQNYTTKTYLTGGATGTTDTTARITDALKVAARLSPRFLASGYAAAPAAGAMSVVNGYFSAHATSCNAIGVPCERQVFVATFETTKANVYTDCTAINNEYVAVCNNRIYRENSEGTLAWLGPHCVAAAAAAMMAGSVVGTPLTKKFVKSEDFDFLATDFDTLDDTDFANGIKNGLLFLEAEPGKGARFAKGITSYSTLDNDLRRYLEGVEERIRHKVILRRAIEAPFVGHKGRGTLTAVGIKRAVVDVHIALANPNDPDFILVAGTDAQGNAVPAFRNIQSTIAGDQVTVTGEVTFTVGINWVINDFRATLPQAVV